MERRTRQISSLALAFLLASCSANYNREWNQALADRAALKGKGTVTGPWQGTWRSEANGHHGELRCIVSRAPAAGKADGGDLHRFHYHATFAGTFSATYDVMHRVKESPRGDFTFSGDQVLTGLGGGFYHYEGKGTAEQFRATFRSESDRGVFELRRP